MNLMNEGVLPPNELDDRDERREESEAQDTETTTDIIAWLRKPREGENAYLTLWRDEIADRLEAAHKRELSKNVSKNGADFGQLGDAAKLREALARILGIADHLLTRLAMPIFANQGISELKRIAEAALAAPARNCDVGTAEEQAKRMDKFCDSHGHGFDGQKCYACENCKLISIDRCELAWAQMPYEEGGAK